MQILVVHTPESPQIRPECCSGTLAGVAVYLSDPISIHISRPLVHAVANGGMGRMAATIALPLVGIEPRTAGGDIGGNQVVASPRIRVITHPEAVLTRLPGHDTDDGQTIVGVGPMPFALIGAPAGRVSRITMRSAFFPPRSGTARPPRRPRQPSPPSGRSRSNWPGGVSGGYAAVSVTALVLGPGGLSAHPLRSRAR
jgi:hypothetical protein